MTDRIFRQYALGFGSAPCQVTCQINGNTVFSGTVTTVDEPMTSLPNAEYVIDNVAWSWTNPVEFEGTQDITITVAGSQLVLAQTLANDPAANADVFGAFYNIEIDGVVYSDPFTEQTIDGIAQSGPYNPVTAGQWWWKIPAGATFTATMHVTAPPPPPEPEPEPDTPPA
jgi:hypothetical protein